MQLPCFASLQPDYSQKDGRQELFEGKLPVRTHYERLKVQTLGLIIVFLGFVALFGCSSKPIASMRSPDGNKEARVFGRWYKGFDATVQIELVSNGVPKMVHVAKGDKMSALVEIVWTPDSNLFGVLEIDQLDEDLWFAYDVRKGKVVDPGIVKEDIRRSVIKRFGLQGLIQQDPSFDPLVWVRQQLDEQKLPRIE